MRSCAASLHPLGCLLQSFSLRSIMSPFGLPSAGSVGSHSSRATHLPRCYASLRLPRCSAALRLPTLGYTFDFPFYHGAIARVFAPAQLALRANLRLVYLELPRRSRFTLRAALCRLPRNRPFAWFPASARCHVFRFPISDFRLFLLPPRRCQTRVARVLAK